VQRLRAVCEAHSELTDAVLAVLENGTGVDTDSLTYADDEAAVDMLDAAGKAYSDLLRWLAALEGKEHLARLMLEGPAGFVAQELRGVDGTTWWSTPDPAEVRDGDGNFLSRDFVERGSGGLRPVPVPEDGPRRVMITRDGHCWELNGHSAVFPPLVRKSYEDRHGEIIEVELFALSDSPSSLMQVKSCGVELTVVPSLARNFGALYQEIVAEREKAGKTT